MTELSMRYTVSDFNKIYSEGSGDFELDESVIQTFEYLNKNLIITPLEDSGNSSKKTNSIGGRSGNFTPSSQKRSSRGPSKNSSVEWDNLRLPNPSFKITKMDVKDGIDKQINDIRALLNKISSKNYDIQMDSVLKNMNEVLTSETVSCEDKNRVAMSVLDIACANKFYSELYAELYKELSVQFPLFNELLPNIVDVYMKTLKNINYIDHNVDYDGFCNYTKTNDLRKANAMFIVNLMKKSVLDKSQVLNIITQLIGFIRLYIDEENRSNEVDEITENIHLFVTHSKKELSEYDNWKTEVLVFIKNMSTFKPKDHPSLSSRALFKYMDILDDLRR